MNPPQAQPLSNIWTIEAMNRTWGQPQVKLSLAQYFCKNSTTAQNSIGGVRGCWSVSLLSEWSGFLLLLLSSSPPPLRPLSSVLFSLKLMIGEPVLGSCSSFWPTYISVDISKILSLFSVNRDLFCFYSLKGLSDKIWKGLKALFFVGPGLFWQ